RRRNTYNLRKFMQGHGRVPVVAEWEERYGGYLFPKATRLRKVQGVPGILAFDAVRWLVKDMWIKWELVDLRTTNIAEAYHNRLNVGFGRDHPDLRTLTEKLEYIDFEAKRSVQWVREHPNEEKHLRKKDNERRQNIENSMERFGERYLRGVTRAEIEEYCKYMSRYVSGKTKYLIMCMTIKKMI
ncbi:hypothetical protein V3C99_018330, partial [Haemonchus contortus]|uniref:Sulfotransfer_1 domain-containing protein n=1 Tax=Haemonchus contortus TaxID=6289 RepID=A0A7I4Z2V2_HAECO